jgi:hypothetical protein
MRNRTPRWAPKTTLQVAIAACYIIVWARSPFFVRVQASACPEARPSEDELTRIRNAGRWLALYEIVCDRADEALAAGLQSSGDRAWPSEPVRGGASLMAVGVTGIAPEGAVALRCDDAENRHFQSVLRAPRQP